MPSSAPLALATAALCALAAGCARPVARALPAPAPRATTLAARLGYAADAKLLILHGDDLGVAHSIDAATLDALEHGVVSSASVMMPTPWVTEVAAWARAHPDHDVGLHLTLTSEWDTFRWGSVAPASAVPTLLDSVGTLPRDTRVVAERAAPGEVERELRAQIERALALGIHPTHLDTHMGALFATPALQAAYVRVAHAYHLPFLVTRGSDGRLPAGVRPERDVIVDTVISAGPEIPRERWTTFYVDAVRALRPGLTEMIVHLGRDDAELRAVTVNQEPWGAAWRERDADAMHSAEFRRALGDNGVVLVRWKDLQRAVSAP
jgi:predicted glycoside hydrolase/deacetylase ChbG (UPF0249 family)